MGGWSPPSSLHYSDESISSSKIIVFSGFAMRKHRALCLYCGRHGDPGLTAALSVEEGSTPGPESVTTETTVLDVPWYWTVYVSIS